MEPKQELVLQKNNPLLLERYKISSPDKWAQIRWEHEIRLGFSALDLVGADNPKINELRKYKSTVEGKLLYLRKPVGLPVWEARYLMDRIPEQDRDAGFDATILRLQRETGYLKELEDVGISSALVAGLENGKFKALVKFLAPENFLAKSMTRKGVAASYAPILDTIFIPEKAPTSEEMWLMLATEGTLPEVIASLDHELTHDAQWSKQQRAAILGLSAVSTASYFALVRKYGVIAAIGISNAIRLLTNQMEKGLKNDEMLQEVHAFEASAESPTNGRERFIHRREIAEHIINAYEPSGKDLPDALYAYDLIHTLRILGMDDQELGKLVNLARFDKKTRSFPRLERAKLEKKSEWGIAGDDDFENVTDTLLAKHDLELALQRHKAEEIATRELKRETGQWFEK